MKSFKTSAVMLMAFLLSFGAFAQRGRSQHNNNYNSHNNYNRSRVTVSVGSRYNYRPAYRPAYRPVYRPYYRPTPVYRTYSYSGYRRPVSYVRYGPSFGFRLNVLPFGYSSFYQGSNPYYYNDGVYYRPYNGGGYQVVEPPLNATVNNLPSSAKATVIDGQKYYQIGGTFYQEEFNEKNKLVYRVVGTDGVLNTDNGNGSPNDYNNNDLNAVDGAIPTIGSRYDELPQDSKVQVINQQKYFISTNGIYYKEVIEGDKIRYEVTTVQ